jgi:hypothetical protein
MWLPGNFGDRALISGLNIIGIHPDGPAIAIVRARHLSCSATHKLPKW